MTNISTQTESQPYGEGFSGTFVKLIMLAIVGLTGFLSLAMFAG